MNDACLTGSKDFEEFLDKRVVILLWDGKYIYGLLRSFDQFNSLTIEDTVERQFVDDLYYEVAHGVYIVRGENVVLVGLSDIDQSRHRKGSYDEVMGMISQRKEKKVVAAQLNSLGI